MKKCEYSEAATGGVVKKLFSEISQNSQENMFFWKGLRPTTLLKKTLWHVFSCEFYEISKNTPFTEQLQTTASGDAFSITSYIQ